MRRAVAAAQEAHLVLHVSDAAASSAGMAPYVGTGEGAPELLLSPHAVDMQVLNKADLLASDSAAACLESEEGAAAAAAPKARQDAAGRAESFAAHAGEQGAAPAAAGVHLISCHTGAGVEQLVGALKQQVLEMVGQSSDAGFSGTLVTRARHRWVRAGE